MKEVQLFLIPAPGAKPEFLAKIRPVAVGAKETELWESLEDTIALEGYTRESWAWKPSVDQFVTLSAESTDGRKKLPGFIKYLCDRQKSAYGRFAPTGIFVISYVQRSNGGNEDQLECRIARDVRKIPNCNIPPKKVPVEQSEQRKPQQQQRQQPNAAAQQQQQPKPKRAGGRGGLLGQLVGAQQRTNQHVVKARPSTSSVAATTATGATTSRTAQEALSAFSQHCNTLMLDFEISSDDVLKVPIILKEQQAGLSQDETQKVTMEILKYVVYEAADEVNEEWIAFKEPSEFVDDVTIAVYKKGAAPPDVLEDIYKGDLPDEAKGQQRAMQEQRERQELQKAAKQKERLEQQAHVELNEYDEDFEALNSNKRDRRTVEDYERERKRGKTS